MNLLAKRTVHIIGIGGIGTSGLAKILQYRGLRVSGSDAESSLITDELQSMGVPIFIGQTAENLGSELEAVVYSSAVPVDNPERVAARARGLPEYSYAQALGEITKSYRTIAVSGTHGKSTTTAMLGLILMRAGFSPTVLVGTRVPQFSHGNVQLGKGEWFVVEACEHAAQMLQLAPERIIITNLEPDHLDFYGSFERLLVTFQEYVQNVDAAACVIPANDPNMPKVFGTTINQTLTFGEHVGDWHCVERKIENGQQHVIIFDTQDNKFELILHVPGMMNVLNALAALAMARSIGVDIQIALAALADFKGSWRRFEILGKTKKGALLVSDYGHHPTAITATLAAAREFYPEKRIVLAYQPHQHHRTKALFNDFIAALRIPDVLILQEIYDVKGREDDNDQNVSSATLATNIPNSFYVANAIETVRQILEMERPNDLILIMGAGDIYKIAADLGAYTSIENMIKENQPLATHSTFRVGGPARFAITVDNVNDLRAALSWARTKQLPWRVLGGGSNLLISDSGFPGLIIWYVDKKININAATGEVGVGAGALTALVAGQTVTAGFSDIVWGVGVPGTIGGAIYGNAGAHGKEIKDVVSEIDVWFDTTATDAQPVVYMVADCQFAYRHSIFKTLSNAIILGARLRLREKNTTANALRLKEVLQQRINTQPQGLASSGCIFKNYELTNATEAEIAKLRGCGIPEKFLTARRIPAGWLIEQSGLKGWRIGDAVVSDIHANFILNQGVATATDIYSLITVIKDAVLKKFTVKLTEEITLL